MAGILSIETSTKVCSLSLAIDGECVFNKEDFISSSHSKLLGIYAKDAVDFAKNNSLAIDAVAVSSGPGSYTGLRIGVSEAKGLCYGFGIPLIAIDSLRIMAHLAMLKYKPTDDTLLCPMIDARRMEVYSAFYDNKLNEIRQVQADIIDEQSYSADYLSKYKVMIFGDGSSKCKEVILSPNAMFLDDIYPLASGMNTLAEEAYKNKQFVDVAYFEPFYLKEFQAVVGKNKVINT